MYSRESLERERVEKFLSDVYFTEKNLSSKRCIIHQSSINSVLYYSPPNGQHPRFHDVVSAPFDRLEVGSQSLGPSWSSHWLKISVEYSTSFEKPNVRVFVRLNTNSEGLVFNDKGEVVEGLNGGSSDDRRTDIQLFPPRKALMPAFVNTETRAVTIFVEMSCNAMFGVGKEGMINAPDPNRFFQVSECSLVVVDVATEDLRREYALLCEAAEQLKGERTGVGERALWTASKAMNQMFVDTPSTLEKGRKEIASFLFGNSSKESRNEDDGEEDEHGARRHVVTAVGHCHIDTAWLWPYRETKRKCARSWGSALALMEERESKADVTRQRKKRKHDDETNGGGSSGSTVDNDSRIRSTAQFNFNFVCSQAQQYAWIEENYPDLFERLKERVAEGSFMPEGGTWVEMDCNVPNGESLCRQFLYGQRYFKEKFGTVCKVFWLPDTFGYTAQLPQIMQKAGISNFLTQKMSWNILNKFPYTSFQWEGLDGSRVFTHFPPADTYNANAKIDEIMKSESNNKDKAVFNESLYLYGFGDGGGGPTREMLKRMDVLCRATASGALKGALPKIQSGDVQSFFSRLQKRAKDLPIYVGELYLEIHRGTYTSQSKIKVGNRRCEEALFVMELLSTLAPSRLGREGDVSLEETLWKNVLLNQFHDVLPGSCIEEVARDAEAYHKEVLSEVHEWCSKWLKDHAESTSTMTLSSKRVAVTEDAKTLFNSTTYPQSLFVDDNIVNIPPLSFVSVTEAKKKAQQSSLSVVEVRSGNAKIYRLDNGRVTALISSNGELESFYDLEDGIEYITADKRANQFVFCEDVPLFWDAWDVEVFTKEKRRAIDISSTTVSIGTAPTEGITFQRKLGPGGREPRSTMTQRISLSPNGKALLFETTIDWNEDRELLKVVFPHNVMSSSARYHIPFGYVDRPTHSNTSWEQAKFETSAHQWASISETNCGLALLNDGKYGYSATKDTLELSLLRSPKSPDESCDIGLHTFTYALLAHSGHGSAKGLEEIYREACLLNNGVLSLSCGLPQLTGLSLCNLQPSNVHISSIKPAEDNPRAFVVRLYEAYGTRCQCQLSLTGLFTAQALLSERSALASRSCSVSCVDLLEHDEIEKEVSANLDVVRFSLSAFEIVTLLITCVEE